jgi:hypothetical protein
MVLQQHGAKPVTASSITFKLGVIRSRFSRGDLARVKAARQGKSLRFRNDRPAMILQYP